MSQRRHQDLDEALTNLYNAAVDLHVAQDQIGTQPIQHVVVNDDAQEMPDAENDVAVNMDVNDHEEVQQEQNESSSSNELLGSGDETPPYDEPTSGDDNVDDNVDDGVVNIDENDQANGKILHKKVKLSFHRCTFSDQAERIETVNINNGDGANFRERSLAPILEYALNTFQENGVTFNLPNGLSYDISEVIREARENPQLWTSVQPRFESLESFGRLIMQIQAFGGTTQIYKTMTRLEKKIDANVVTSKKILTQARSSAQTSSANLQMTVRERITQKKSPWKVGKVSAANVYVRRSLDKYGLASGYESKDPLNQTVYTLSDEDDDDEDEENGEKRCENPECPHEQDESEDEGQELLKTYTRKRKHDQDQGPGAGGAAGAIAT